MTRCVLQLVAGFFLSHLDGSLDYDEKRMDSSRKVRRGQRPRSIKVEGGVAATTSPTVPAPLISVEVEVAKSPYNIGQSESTKFFFK